MRKSALPKQTPASDASEDTEDSSEESEEEVPVPVPVSVPPKQAKVEAKNAQPPAKKPKTAANTNTTANTLIDEHGESDFALPSSTPSSVSSKASEISLRSLLRSEVSSVKSEVSSALAAAPAEERLVVYGSNFVQPLPPQPERDSDFLKTFLEEFKAEGRKRDETNAKLLQELLASKLEEKKPQVMAIQQKQPPDVVHQQYMMQPTHHMTMPQGMQQMSQPMQHMNMPQPMQQSMQQSVYAPMQQSMPQTMVQGMYAPMQNMMPPPMQNMMQPSAPMVDMVHFENWRLHHQLNEARQQLATYTHGARPMYQQPQNCSQSGPNSQVCHWNIALCQNLFRDLITLILARLHLMIFPR